MSRPYVLNLEDLVDKSMRKENIKKPRQRNVFHFYIKNSTFFQLAKLIGGSVAQWSELGI